jgi:hypothetical protein
MRCASQVLNAYAPALGQGLYQALGPSPVPGQECWLPCPGHLASAKLRSDTGPTQSRTPSGPSAVRRIDITKPSDVGKPGLRCTTVGSRLLGLIRFHLSDSLGNCLG